MDGLECVIVGFFVVGLKKFIFLVVFGFLVLFFLFFELLFFFVLVVGYY